MILYYEIYLTSETTEKKINLRVNKNIQNHGYKPEFYTPLTAPTWLKYCKYGIKFNLSIHINFQITENNTSKFFNVRQYKTTYK